MSKELNTLKQEINIVSAFTPVAVPPTVTNDPVSEEDIVDTLIVDGYEQDAEGNIRPVTKQIVTGKKNRKAYIESFSDDVGLENVLKQLASGAIAEDKYSILKSQKVGTVTDLRGIQQVDNLGDVEALAAKARATFANLDPALKKNMSFAEFCTKFGDDDLIAYIKAKTEKKVEEKAE